MLSKKACLRFFTSLEKHPRFASEFVSRIPQGIDHDLLGVSTLTWWDWAKAELGDKTTTTPFYQSFRSTLQTDLRTSERLQATGLTDILIDTLRYCFKADK